MFFKFFSRQIYFSRTFQDSPVYSSTFQACANPVASMEPGPEKFTHSYTIIDFNEVDIRIYLPEK